MFQSFWRRIGKRQVMQLQLTWIEAKLMATSHTILLLLLPIVTGVTIQDVSYSIRHRATRAFVDDVIKSFLNRAPTNIHANKTGHPQLPRLQSMIANTSDNLEHSISQTLGSTSIFHLVNPDSPLSNGAITNNNLSTIGNTISNNQPSDGESHIRSVFLNVLSGNIHKSITENSISTSLKDKATDISNITSSADKRQDDIRFTSAHKRNYAGVACELDEIRIDMVFREYREADTRSYLLECRGNILVNKCEGGCEARVSPSVNHYGGFLRFCSCCRETGVTPRDVTLTHCNIGEEAVHGYSLTRTIVEPSGCTCQECRN